MDKLLTSLSELAAAAGGRALLVLLLGRLMIRSLLRLLDKSRLLTRAEGTVRSFTRSFIRIGLHLLLTISIIGILGVPMASVITVLASAGVTVGLALQGALSNLAGGVMLMLFRPFRQGDYISAAGVEGTVRAWCRSEDYWALYYDLTQRITETMAEHRIPSPAVRVTTDAPSGKEGTSQ